MVVRSMLSIVFCYTIEVPFDYCLIEIWNFQNTDSTNGCFNCSAVSLVSVFFEEFTAAKSDCKLLPGGTKQCCIVQNSFVATSLSFKQEQKLLTFKDALLCPIEAFGNNNSDIGWRSSLSSVKIADFDGCQSGIEDLSCELKSFWTGVFYLGDNAQSLFLVHARGMRSECPETISDWPAGDSFKRRICFLKCSQRKFK